MIDFKSAEEVELLRMLSINAAFLKKRVSSVFRSLIKSRSAKHLARAASLCSAMAFVFILEYLDLDVSEIFPCSYGRIYFFPSGRINNRLSGGVKIKKYE